MPGGRKIPPAFMDNAGYSNIDIFCIQAICCNGTLTNHPPVPLGDIFMIMIVK